MLTLLLKLASLEDWIADLQSATMTEYAYCDGCQVGTGWLTACESLQSGVTEALAGIVSHHADKDLRIVVTGTTSERASGRAARTFALLLTPASLSRSIDFQGTPSAAQWRLFS